MKILVTANITPFLHGGADAHILGLVDALTRHGHQTELLRLPFQFQPLHTLDKLMAFCQALDLQAPNGQNIDRLISLQFPGYGISHPEHTVWVMHQHRAVYELYEPEQASPELTRLKTSITAYDNLHLGRVKQLFANSRRVAERLGTYNGLEAKPLYHPPANAERFRADSPLPYIFYPSRLEALKRQDLLIEALALVPDGLPVILAGEGGQRARYQQLIERLGLQDRVRLLGRISEAEKIAWYANATAVFFGPYDEDYGYITLEAMLSGKPVITCSDSGGPLEFVKDGQTGWVVPPDPAALADRLAQIAGNPAQAAALGQNAKEFILSQGITWDNVVAQLLQQ